VYQDRISDQAKARPPVGEADLRLYLGPNADSYVHYRDRARAGSRPFLWHWNWWGFLFPVPWLFYRKLWAVGVALVLLPVLLDALYGFGTQMGIALAALIAAWGKPLVIERAERKVRQLDGLGLVSQHSIEWLRRAGGVSLPGALLGALLTLSLLGLYLYGKFPARLPGCEAPMVRATVLDIARDNAEQTGLPADQVELSGVRQEGVARNGPGPGRLCSAELRAAADRLPVEYEIFWQSRGEGRYVIDLRLRDE